MVDLCGCKKELSCKEYKVCSKETKRRGDVVKQLTMCDNDKKLASIRMIDHDTSIRLENWKTHVKGRGHGKQLIDCVIKSKPGLFHIATDGFTENGYNAFKKVVEKYDFQITEWIHGTHAGVGNAFRQDFIDMVIDRQEKGHRMIFHFVPSFHSKYKGRTK